MSNYDPFSGQQVKFLRSDPSGRWSPIVEPDPEPPTWFQAGCMGVFIGVVLALMFWLGLGA